METNLRQIEVLTNAWNTVSNMFIRNDEELDKKRGIILDELTRQLLEKVRLYLKSGQ